MRIRKKPVIITGTICALCILLYIIILSHGGIQHAVRNQQSIAHTSYSAAKVYTASMQYQGIKRSYIVSVPANFEGKTGNLLILLHGAGSNGNELYHAIGSIVSDNFINTITVYPNGTTFNGSGSSLSWNAVYCCGQPVVKHIDDMGFITRIIADITKSYTISSAKVYIAGHSNGAILTYELVCSRRLPIAGAGIIAGAVLFSACRTPAYTHLFIVHGTQDKIIPFNGGSLVVPQEHPVSLTIPSVHETIEYWKHLYTCASEHVQTDGNARIEDIYNCHADASIEAVTITGASHYPLYSDVGNTITLMAQYFNL